ncbi:DUF7344 domain-containing protein [Halorarum salinum]|uniref:ArsR family transcriptional regulator n=1 Tax=Halorarum salinum TaxID=2743089 RepID=A0A7D5Q9X9_9EURY|nr:ArsR family transcriptional regulator [Halobaculum salinum]QLG61318.1 ArsR family transcriptional regulator [Halobaculum salinum]
MVSHGDEVLGLLADAGYRAILTVLWEAEGPLHATELADRLVTGEAPLLDASEYERETERTLVSLHHHRLPKLADAGLVEYDRDERTVDVCGYPDVEAEWFDCGMVDEALARFRPGRRSDEEGVGVLEGREDVYRYARRLADEAEEELFLIYASDDLLDQGCLPQARNAIERGVRFCVGSGDPAVREFFRANLPGATVWEPQLDWANDPSAYPRVDRLVFADREAIVLGLLDGADADGEPAAAPVGETATASDDGPTAGTDGERTETAMVGRGESNPLVTFARELLGPRLDHLDHQSEGFRDELRGRS